MHIYHILEKDSKSDLGYIRCLATFFPGNCAICIESVLRFRSRLTKYTFCLKLKKDQHCHMKRLK